MRHGLEVYIWNGIMRLEGIVYYLAIDRIFEGDGLCDLTWFQELFSQTTSFLTT